LCALSSNKRRRRRIAISGNLNQSYKNNTRFCWSATGLVIRPSIRYHWDEGHEKGKERKGRKKQTQNV